MKQIRHILKQRNKGHGLSLELPHERRYNPCMQRARKEDIKQIHVLKNRSDFVAMNKGAAKWVSHGLVLQVMANKTDEIRVGYTVTKKTDKSAVRRNRIKRRLRAAAADILPVFAAKGHDYVLIGRHKTALRRYEDLTNDLKWCLKKLEKIAP